MQSSKPGQSVLSKQKLTTHQIEEFLRNHPDWAVQQGMLVRFWTFNDFVEAIAFVNRVARLAEQARHHPDIDIRYNRVKLALVSHDAGGLTTRDSDLATKLSSGFAVARTA